MADLSAYRILNELAAASRALRDAPLPMAEEVSQDWQGLGFELAGFRFVTPMHEVAEVLLYPSVTAIPNTVAWVDGVANVRGRLLPIYHLARFFGVQYTVPRQQRRVIVIDTNDVLCGLIVDQVLGMQQFVAEERTDEVPEVFEGIQPWVRSGYFQNRSWAVISLFELVAAEAFVDVSSLTAR